MSSLREIIAGMKQSSEEVRAHITDNWMQGRTTYGGASTALAVAAAQRFVGVPLPPLRSAQVVFHHPMGADATFEPTMIRQGRTGTVVRVDGYSDGVIALFVMLFFGEERESQVDLPPPTREDLPLRGALVPPPPNANFLHNFELADAGQMPGRGRDMRFWTRLKDRDGLKPDVEMVAIADIMPPVGLFLMPEKKPISTITWQLNVLTAKPQTEDGWWLASAVADNAQAGLSGQTMRIENASGQLVATTSQTIALFG